MTYEQFKAYCLSKKGAEEAYPFGSEAVWFRIDGKAFAWTFVEDAKVDGQMLPPYSFVNLKADPELVEAQRAAHDAIQPGWHQNKRHWHSVYTNGDVDDDHFQALIDTSYQLVVASLTKKRQKELGLQ